MNSTKQTSSRQTEPACRSARETKAWPPDLARLFMPFDKEWILSKNLMCLGLAALVWGMSNLGYAVQSAESSSADDPPVQHVITGTLDQLDFNTGKGQLKTDLGKPLFFDMVRPESFRRLSVGQRVTIGVNEQGQAVKVMEIPPAELPSPPAAGQ